MKVQAAISGAQQQIPSYTYEGFCQKVIAAGNTGYIVSFIWRRVVYFGRTAEMHIDDFPK